MLEWESPWELYLFLVQFQSSRSYELMDSTALCWTRGLRKAHQFHKVPNFKSAWKAKTQTYCKPSWLLSRFVGNKCMWYSRRVLSYPQGCCCKHIAAACCSWSLTSVASLVFFSLLHSLRGNKAFDFNQRTGGVIFCNPMKYYTLCRFQPFGNSGCTAKDFHLIPSPSIVHEVKIQKWARPCQFSNVPHMQSPTELQPLPLREHFWVSCWDFRQFKASPSPCQSAFASCKGFVVAVLKIDPALGLSFSLALCIVNMLHACMWHSCISLSVDCARFCLHACLGAWIVCENLG